MAKVQLVPSWVWTVPEHEVIASAGASLAVGCVVAGDEGVGKEDVSEAEVAERVVGASGEVAGSPEQPVSSPARTTTAAICRGRPGCGVRWRRGEPGRRRGSRVTRSR